MPFVSACGLDVHYVSHGPGPDADPPTAVLLHGFTPDHRLMTGAFEPVFTARERRPGGVAWRRLYLDLPGMGRTRSAAHVTGTDVVLEVVREAVDRLVPAGRVALCGQSYGGYLARGLVASTPGRFSGLALVCPMLVADHTERDVPPHRVLVRDPDLAAGLAVDAEFREIAVVQTQETFRRTQQEVVPGLAEADEAALDRIRQGWAGSFALESAGSTYDEPVLVFTGRQDSSTGYRDAWPLLEHYPRATFAVLDRAGHNGHIEQPVLFEALVHEWLDRVEEAAGSRTSDLSTPHE